MYKVNLLQIKQFNANEIYVGNISFKELAKRVRLTSRKTSSTQLYQREPDKKRIQEIADYINKAKYKKTPLFTTPLVLSCSTDIYTEYNEEVINAIDNKIENAILINKGGNESILYELYLPDLKELVFIVDGQHRFLGTEKFFQDELDRIEEAEKKLQVYESIYDDLEFSVTYLPDYSLYDQSKVFANINFEQKPVNKSIFYDIFGSLPNEKDDMTFAYHLIKALNESSEYKNIIKMLGTGSGVVSLASMMSTILDHLVNEKGNLYTVFMGYKKGDSDKYKILPQIFIDYFVFIKKNFSQYFPIPIKAEKTINKFYSVKDFTNRISKKKLITECENEEALEDISIEDLFQKSTTLQKLIPVNQNHKNLLELLYSKGYSTPYYNSYDYKKHYLFKSIGMYALLRIFNDLYEDIEKIEVDYSSNKLEKLLSEKFKDILLHPAVYFEDSTIEGAGSASLQSKCYKLLYSSIFK